MASERRDDTPDRAGQRLHLGQRREAWWRGPAVIEGDWITIDRRRTEEYHPTLFADLRPGENPLAELAIVRRPRDAVAFARSFGLLYPLPDDGPWRESFRVWEQQAQLLRLGLTLYADVQATMADRTPERIRALREAWSPMLALGRPDVDIAATTDVGLFSLAADTVVSIVNEGIGTHPSARRSRSTRRGARCGSWPIPIRETCSRSCTSSSRRSSPAWCRSGRVPIRSAGDRSRRPTLGRATANRRMATGLERGEVGSEAGHREPPRSS